MLGLSRVAVALEYPTGMVGVKPHTLSQSGVFLTSGRRWPDAPQPSIPRRPRKLLAASASLLHRCRQARKQECDA